MCAKGRILYNFFIYSIIIWHETRLRSSARNLPRLVLANVDRRRQPVRGIGRGLATYTRPNTGAIDRNNANLSIYTIYDKTE